MRRAPAATALLALLALFSGACAAHEKAGDRASAVGDWKTAEHEYAQALRKDPKEKELQAKYREARTRAVQEAGAKARACAAAQDWECALGESQYALGLEPGDAALAVLRRDAGREAGRLRLRHAGEALDRGQAGESMELLEAARAATDDPGVEGEVRQLTPAVVRAAVAGADGFRAQHQYPQALDLLSRAARLDPAVGPRLQAVQAEHEQWKDAEAERLAREGDALLSARRLPEARARYDQAAAIRPQGRAAPMARYTGLLTEGEAAVARRDFERAERAFSEAAQSPADHGWAREALERVVPRLYAVRLRSVRVRRGGPPGDLVVAVRLPDGRSAETPPRPGSIANLDSSFVVAANAYDDRAVALRVLRVPPRRRGGGDDPPFDLGAITFRLADLLARRELSLADGAVDELRVEWDPADLPEGAVTGLLPVPDAENRARAFPRVSARSRAFQVVGIRAALAPPDVRPGAPLRVEIEQDGEVVVSTPPQPGPALELRPGGLRLFLEPDRPVLFRLVRDDPAGPTPVLSRTATGRELDQGPLRIEAPSRSRLELTLERVRDRGRPERW